MKKKVLFTCIGGSSAGTKPIATSLLSAILKMLDRIDNKIQFYER